MSFRHTLQPELFSDSSVQGNLQNSYDGCYCIIRQMQGRSRRQKELIDNLQMPESLFLVSVRCGLSSDQPSAGTPTRKHALLSAPRRRSLACETPDPRLDYWRCLPSQGRLQASNIGTLTLSFF